MACLDSYQFYTNGTVQFVFKNGASKLIRLTKNSGRVVTRKKVDTISNIDHPGIYVGKEYYSGEPFILHNHYKLFGTAGVSPMWEYASGIEVFWDNRVCVNNKMTVLQKGLNHAIERRKYHWLSNNCQITVNDACNNENRSEDVERWFGRIATGFIGLLFFKALTN